MTLRAIPTEPNEDVALAQRAASDREAFQLLYERHFSVIHSFMRAQTHDDATADDLTSQVFYRALTSAASYRGEGSYRSWIFQIARNTLATWRSERDRLQIALPDIEDEVVDPETPAAVTLAEEERDLVWETVQDLPEAQREVVRLRYWRNLSVDEIATTTHRSSVAVRQLLHRAKRQLRKRLSNKDLTVLLGATGASALFAATYHRRRKGAR